MRLMTAEAVSKLLRVPQRRVYDLTQAGILPAVRLGRQLRWDEDALRAFVDAGGKGLGPGDERPASPDHDRSGGDGR
jgi:excisionase family DNA binding protein